MRRLRSDLILVFKIVKGYVNVEADKFFQFLEDPRIFKQTCRLNIQMYTFSQRVIMEWNPLPPEAVIAKTENLFKGVIDPLFQQNMGLCISQRRLPALVLRSH